MGSIYDVTIAAINNAAPADGFIDPKSSYSYMDTDGDAPNTLANAKAKMRANRRYKTLIMQVQYMMNAYVVSVSAPGATADTPATSLNVRFDIEKGDSSLVTEDENNAGVMLTGEAALKRLVARSLLVAETRNFEFFDPTVVPGRQIDGSANAGIARGPVINKETVGALAATIAAAEAAVTVTKVS
jgi:hypothetical protein